MDEGRKIVTFSFDDAFPKDEEVALLLEKYGFKATFYFPQNVQHGKIRSRMDVLAMRRFAKNHSTMEIGQHGFNHLFLTKVSLAEAVEDIQLGYDWHRGMFGSFPTCFAYPRGYYTEDIAKAVEVIGYECARTTVSQRKLQNGRYEMGGMHFPIDEIQIKDRMNVWSHSWELGSDEMNSLESLIRMLKDMNYESVTNTQYANIFFPR